MLVTGSGKAADALRMNLVSIPSSLILQRQLKIQPQL